MRFTGPDAVGVYDLPDEVYHADPCPEPSLSSSIVKRLDTRTPRHAWLAHPRLNPDFEPDHDPGFDLGSAAHDYLLRGGDAIEVIDGFDDWRKGAAKTARDAARAAGRVPLLRHQFDQVRSMAGAAKAQLARHKEASDAFLLGKPEQTLIWSEADGAGGSIWCRAKLDWQPIAGNVFYDFKSTTSAAAGDFERVVFGVGHHLQHAFYRRGISAVLDVRRPIFRFVVQEIEPPYALNVFDLSPEAAQLAESRVNKAMHTWAWCMRHRAWPGYVGRVAHLGAPVWMQRRNDEEAVRDEVDRESGEDIRKLMLNWQAPVSAPKSEATP